jgi:hypothetical protein
MTPSAIVLNVCAAVFLTLASIFFSYLINRYRVLRKHQVRVTQEAKQIPLYKQEPSTVLQPTAKYSLAEAK